jgi:hypothetical protein
MGLTIKRRGDTTVQDNGIWSGVITFQCPWAHPLWTEYMLLVYDLKTQLAGHETIKYDPRVTHEFLLYALDPEQKIDFEKSGFEQKNLMPLQPANHGYQFIAESDDKAWELVNELVDACFRQVTPGVFAMSPDSDYHAQWDHKMQGIGWTLLVS